MRRLLLRLAFWAVRLKWGCRRAAAAVPLADGSELRVRTVGWDSLVRLMEFGARGAVRQVALAGVDPRDRERLAGLDLEDLVRVAIAVQKLNVTPAFKADVHWLAGLAEEVR